MTEEGATEKLGQLAPAVAVGYGKNSNDGEEHR